MMAIKILVFAGMIMQATSINTCSMCPAGEYLKSTSPCICSPCPNNTFTDKVNNASKCQKCRTTCPKSKIIAKKCTSISDATCECPKGQFFDTGVLFCIDCTVCPIGFGSFIKCTTESNTDCKPCIQGKTYSNRSSMEPCTTCSSCSGNLLRIQKPCNTTKNTICVRDMVYPSNSSGTTKTLITTKATLATTKSKSHPPKTNEVMITLVVVGSVIVVLCMVGFFIYYYRRHRGQQHPIRDDLEDSHEGMKLNENLEEKPAQPCPQHSGLRDGLLRDAPYQVIEQLGLKLNPRGLNNWVRLAGKLNYTKDKIDYFSIEPEMATQRMLADWMTSNSSTIKVLHKHLKAISRDDAAEILEV